MTAALVVPFGEDLATVLPERPAGPALGTTMDTYDPKKTKGGDTEDRALPSRKGARALTLARFSSTRSGSSGDVRVHLEHADFPDEQGMFPDDLAAATTDGRTLAALRRLGL